MRANYIHLDLLLRSVLDSKIQGDLAEFGVWYGTTFLPMAELARINSRTIHAIDSFNGMAEPTSKDGGKGYKQGSHSTNGSAFFRMLVEEPFGDTVKIHEGYIPEILRELIAIKFAFAHIDLDQYQPTLETLNFVWPRMNKGGVMVCHDWFSDVNILAAEAINDWMKKNNIVMAGSSIISSHCWFIK